jgi:hypothetical protein
MDDPQHEHSTAFLPKKKRAAKEHGTGSGLKIALVMRI